MDCNQLDGSALKDEVYLHAVPNLVLPLRLNLVVLQLIDLAKLKLYLPGVDQFLLAVLNLDLLVDHFLNRELLLILHSVHKHANGSPCWKLMATHRSETPGLWNLRTHPRAGTSEIHIMALDLANWLKPM